MKIKQVLFTPGYSSFFFDDQRAVRNGAVHDGFVYSGKPVTSGFSAIRMPGETVSIQIQLDNGRWAKGDCAAVQYSGAGGRDPVFSAASVIPMLEKNIRQILIGTETDSFRTLVAHFENLEIEGKKLHTAVRYGLSQALLDAAALSQNITMAEVIIKEYGLPLRTKKVPIFGQSGDDRYINTDKMILKKIDVLPHALINNVDDKLGRDGSKLKEYIRWLVRRIKTLRTDSSYSPVLHIDVYGTIGQIFNNNTDKTAEFLAGLEKDTDGFSLYIEGPVDMESKLPQINTLSEIKRNLTKLGSRVKIVADEWCNLFEDIRDFTDADACHMIQIKTPDLGGIQNTIESVRYCKQHGMEAYQGGTCNETDISARVCVHAAVAAGADRMLAKPGMGFDEGYTIVHNEMQRLLAVLRENNNSCGYSSGSSVRSPENQETLCQ